MTRLTYNNTIGNSSEVLFFERLYGGVKHYQPSLRKISNARLAQLNALKYRAKMHTVRIYTSKQNGKLSGCIVKLILLCSPIFPMSFSIYFKRLHLEQFSFVLVKRYARSCRRNAIASRRIYLNCWNGKWLSFITCMAQIILKINYSVRRREKHLQRIYGKLCYQGSADIRVVFLVFACCGTFFTIGILVKIRIFCQHFPYVDRACALIFKHFK